MFKRRMCDCLIVKVYSRSTALRTDYLNVDEINIVITFILIIAYMFYFVVRDCHVN